MFQSRPFVGTVMHVLIIMDDRGRNKIQDAWPEPGGAVYDIVLQQRLTEVRPVH